MCKCVVILATLAAFCHLTLGGRTNLAYQKPSYSDFTSMLKGYYESRGYPEMKHWGYYNNEGPHGNKFKCYEDEWNDSKHNEPSNWHDRSYHGYGGDWGSESYGGDRSSENYGGDSGSENYGGDRSSEYNGGERSSEYYGGGRGNQAYGGGSHWHREQYPRQNQGWMFGNFQPWTTTRAPEKVPPVVLTTQTPLRVVMCIQTCPVTPEYNPVCGSNGKTYGNIGRLECAQYCGVDVSLAFSASCSQPVPTTASTEPTRYTTIEAGTNRFPTEPIAVTPPFDTPVTSLPVETTTEDAPDIDIRFPDVSEG